MANEPQKAGLQKMQMPAKDLPVDMALDAPVIFIDGLQGFSLSPGNIVKINAFQDMMTAGDDAPVHRKVALRLVMTLDQFKKIHSWMGDILAKLPDSAKSADVKPASSDA